VFVCNFVLWCAVCVQDDTYEHQGAHVFLPGSNLRLLQGLAKGVPILYKTPALLVQYCSKGVSDTHRGVGEEGRQ
jgi:hypothetical protein